MLKLGNTLYFKALNAKNAVLKALKSERGDTNIIAIIIILAIVIALAIVFRKAIGDLFNSIWDGITQDVNGATSGYANGAGSQ